MEIRAFQSRKIKWICSGSKQRKNRLLLPQGTISSFLLYLIWVKNSMHLHLRHLADVHIQSGSQWVSKQGFGGLFKDTMTGYKAVCWAYCLLEWWKSVTFQVEDSFWYWLLKVTKSNTENKFLFLYAFGCQHRYTGLRLLKICKSKMLKSQNLSQ